VSYREKKSTPGEGKRGPAPLSHPRPGIRKKKKRILYISRLCFSRWGIRKKGEEFVSRKSSNRGNKERGVSSFSIPDQKGGKGGARGPFPFPRPGGNRGRKGGEDSSGRRLFTVPIEKKGKKEGLVPTIVPLALLVSGGGKEKLEEKKREDHRLRCCCL